MATQAELFKNKYLQEAIAASQGTKIFPATILAAAALESGYGQSQLAKQANNFFGIKASKGWTGEVVYFDTKEQDDKGNVYVVNAPFRKYPSAKDSFANYVKFVSGPRYVKAGVLTADTPQQQIERIKAAGYATDTKYVSKLTAMLKSFGEMVSDNPGTTAIVAALLFFF